MLGETNSRSRSVMLSRQKKIASGGLPINAIINAETADLFTQMVKRQKEMTNKSKGAIVEVLERCIEKTYALESETLEK